MKIGILTQPLKTNYGGLIQAFALKKTLQDLGHEVWIINRVGFLRRNQKKHLILLSKLKKAFFKLLDIEKKLSEKETAIISKNCAQFISKYIKDVSIDIKTCKQLYQYAEKEKFDGYVVGSDQVWRPSYSPCIENYFLDFCYNRQVKRIAYAASFGGNQWEYTKKETTICSNLAKLFNGISVREDSAIDLCNKYLGVDAKHVLDPTMLLDKEDYEQIVNDENEPTSEGDLFYYFLDNNPEKQNLIKYIESKYNKVAFNCMPSKNAKKGQITSNIEDYVFPKPSKWLKSFMDAKMVITDSFHGTVFSIIFNKPFWVIYNPHRGNTRFDSLLKLFGMTERIINLSDYSNIDFNKTIDWNKINSIRENNRKESIEFIRMHLSD